RRPLRRCVERGSDARPALVGLRRPTLVRPRLCNARHGVGLGYPRCVTLDNDVRVADRHRNRTPGIARDVAALAGTRAGLEPEGAVHPEGTDRSHVRAAVLVEGGQPRRAGVRRVRSRRRSGIELVDNGGPIHRRQAVRLTQIDDLHFLNLPAGPSSASENLPRVAQPGSSAWLDEWRERAPQDREGRVTSDDALMPPMKPDMKLRPAEFRGRWETVWWYTAALRLLPRRSVR